jgi:3-deoxy-D-manno-octulosonic-acid transferase
MLRTMYRAAATLAPPFLNAMLARRARRGKEWPDRLDERRGIDATPRPAGQLLWLHAASVGETMSVLPVLSAFAALAPEATVLMTTGSVTSAGLLGARLPEMGLDRVTHRFVPLDVPEWGARFLDHWRPDAAVFVESEIWPNLLAGCAARRIPLMLLNARMSDRSFDRWRRTGGFARDLFGAFDRVLARNADDATHFRALGARDVIEAGNLKFAAPPLPAPRIELERLRRKLGSRPVWLAASTHPGEEAMMLDVHAGVAERAPGLLTIIAPRHPARGAEVAELAGRMAAPSATGRRSLDQDLPDGGVYVADTIGELGLFFSLAKICFVGGSFVPLGGHNPLEPARLGCAVSAGPFMANFADAAAVLEAAGAFSSLADPGALTRWVEALLNDSGRRRMMGEAGIAASHRYADLPQRVAAMLAALMAARP